MPRPIYVERLDADRRQHLAELAELYSRLGDLRDYLNSPKFRAPSERQDYVNVEDVLLRLNEATHFAMIAGEEARANGGTEVT
jgi:hypothetical protein